MLNELNDLFSVSKSKHEYDNRVRFLNGEMGLLEKEMNNFCEMYNEWLINEKTGWRLICLTPNECTQILWNVSILQNARVQKFRISKPILDALKQSKKAEVIDIGLKSMNQNAFKNLESIEQKRVALNQKMQVLRKIIKLLKSQVKYRRIVVSELNELY